MTRRAFLQTAAAIAGVAVLPAQTFAQGSAAPVRMSLTAFSTESLRVKKLREAFRAMDALPPSNPSSLFFQAGIHALPMTRGEWWTDESTKPIVAQFRADPNAASMLGFWNRCTHFGANAGADFVIWHRAYLYYFERHVRSVLSKLPGLEDPQFCLPYWDYQDPNNRALPPIFARDANPSPTGNPLGCNKGPGRRLDSGAVLRPTQVSSDSAFNVSNFFSDGGFAAFGGHSVRNDDGVLDEQPHGTVHSGIGGWMGNVETAGFDPIFWVHHANIDRLFNKWLSSDQRYWSRAPLTQAALDLWLDQSPYTFIDADGSQKSEKRRFFLDQKALNYRYDTDPATIPSMKLSQSGRGTGAGRSIFSIPPNIVGIAETPAGKAPQQTTLTGRQTIRVGIPLEAALVAQGQSPPSGVRSLAVESIQASDRNYVVLDLKGIERATPVGSSNSFRVYVTFAEGGDSKPDTELLLGTLSTFDAPISGDRVNRKIKSARFDLSTVLQKNANKVRGNQLYFIFEPEDAVDAAGKVVGKASDAKLTIKEIQITILKGSTNPVE
jgi:hypothetical protein